jgi:hypothetical protein
MRPRVSHACQYGPAADTTRRRAERTLQALGVDRAFAEDLLGDLAEEYALRAAHDGVASARRWYAAEALRAMPHLVRSAVRTASLQSPARLSLAAMGLALAAWGVVAALEARRGPPAYLLPGLGGFDGPVVVSTMRPVRLPVRVFDADGDALAPLGVRYAWESGTPLEVSPEGAVRCAARGDAVVRASLGALVTRVALSCQPVRWLHLKPWYNFALGDPAQPVRVGAVGVDGAPVTRLAADVRVADTRVATFERTPGGMRLTPRGPGRTEVQVHAGGGWAQAAVTVFEPVATLKGLRDDQRFVLASTAVAPRAAVRWPLPAGRFWLVNQVDANGDAPLVAVDGPVTCAPALAPGVYRTRCEVRGRGASVTLAHPGAAVGPLVGTLAIEREGEAPRSRAVSRSGARRGRS